MRKRVIAALLIGASVPLSACANTNQEWHRNCTVQAKDMITSVDNGTSSRTKRLSTSCGSYNVDDALEVGMFDSWDLWQKLEVGKTYDIKTGGQRIGILSTFPTVLEVAGPK